MPGEKLPTFHAARQVWLSAGAPIVGLVALMLVAAVLVFSGFAREQDRNFADSSRQLVTSAIDGRLHSLANTTLDYANWDDALQAVTIRWDAAWIANNLYSAVTDGVIVFRTNGAMRHAWITEDERAEAAAIQTATIRAALALPNLRDLPHAPTPQQTVAHSITTVNGRLALVAVAPIASEDNQARLARNRALPVDYIASVQILDPADIAEIGHSLDLEGFTFASAYTHAPDQQLVTLPLTTLASRPVGALQWRDERPGSAALFSQLGPVILALLIVGAFTILVTRRLVARQVAHMAHAEAALESSRVKSEFIATMSHELRTPLNAIIGYSEMIQEEIAPGDTSGAAIAQDAGRILAAARQLSQLVNDILDQSRIDAGRLPLNLEALVTTDILTEVREVMEPAATAKNLAFRISADPNARFVHADHQRLRQCLINLASNAVKFSHAGAISMHARTDMKNGRAFIVIDVADNGHGVAEDEMESIFAPFMQGKSKFQARFGGSGLGLSISRKLARAMGGDITVASHPGRGATFSLALPAERALAIVNAA